MKSQSLKILNQTQQSTSNGPFRMSDLEVELKGARLNLKQVEIEEQISDIFGLWDIRINSHQNIRENVEKKHGSDLSNIKAIDCDPMLDHVNNLKERFKGMNSGDYDAEPYTFRIPSLGSLVCNVLLFQMKFT